jgi:hypothetical protein
MMISQGLLWIDGIVPDKEACQCLLFDVTSFLCAALKQLYTPHQM